MSAKNDIDLTERRYSPKEAACVVGCCVKTILTRISEGEISPVIRKAKAGPGAIEIPESSIKAYLVRKIQSKTPALAAAAGGGR